MEIGKDILEKVGKPSMEVPEGYFDSLKTRLSAIPAKQEERLGTWSRVRPYLALAASFAAILIIGNAVLSGTAGKKSAEPSITEANYAEIILMTNPETIYDMMDKTVEEVSDEDIINYLIESGVSTEQLAYVGDQK